MLLILEQRKSTVNRKLWPARHYGLPDMGSTLGALSAAALGAGTGEHESFQKLFFMQDFLLSSTGVLFVWLQIQIVFS